MPLAHHPLTLSTLLAALSSPSLAQTELFIGEYQYQAARMTAIQLDGSNPRTLFSLAPASWLPIGITVNPVTHKLIWIDSAGASEVMQANLDGSNTQVLASISGFARGASIDAQGRIYYATDNRIERVNADGSGKIILHTASTTNPSFDPRVDAVNGHVYFGIAGFILRTNLDGSNLKTIVQGVQTPRSIAIDIANNAIYWIDSNTNTDFVGKARLDGTEFRVLYDVTPNNVTSSFLSALILDPATQTLYWSDEVAATVTRAAADGSGASIIYTAPSGFGPAGLMFAAAEPAQPLHDCNANGIADDIDIASGAPDCDNNGWLDACQVRPCPNRTFLLDTGSDAAASNGRALGQPSQWQIFQPFVVPAGGWSIGEIGVDGFLTNYVATPLGLTARLYRNNPATSRPDESVELAHTSLDLRFNTDYVNWVYAPLTVTLTPGTYWVRLEANDPIHYFASVNLGFTGLSSLSRGTSGVFIDNAHRPVALRLAAATLCPADFDGDGTVDFFDYDAFVSCFEGQACPPGKTADFDSDGSVDFFDYDAFVVAFESPC